MLARITSEIKFYVGPMFLGIGQGRVEGIKVNHFYSDISHKNASRVGS